MNSQVAALIGRQRSEGLQRGGFRCFCGEWFPNRELFDEHLKQDHPGKFTVCDCCRRVLPKGSWTIDENVNFVSVDRRAVGIPQGLPKSAGA